ncbi:hypothetical protein GRI38_10835 [Altererythrobacter aurantiacus]|uniref:Uncharacterized protein n=1 Tax=Parapontixanthobacter aurantiacus TaxID=1463599 RepID=A0A844ZHR6_9SPHN|nr:hypothetical protein [Parapontixanthobacter aurantiacus]MXO86520.1 hypothetical protein [Parapontixanthobacter aurantiacus]
MAACPLRYVLDIDASLQCADLIRDCPELMSLEKDVLRLPASDFWLEWFCEPEEPGSEISGLRLGCLARATEDGRSGTLVPFYAAADGAAKRLPGTIEFDLDRDVPRSALGSRNFTHRLFPHLDHILRHAFIVMDERWVAKASKKGLATLQNMLTLEAEGTWFYLPYLLTFSLLLNSPNVVQTRNGVSASVGSGAPIKAVTDHIEVSMHLGETRRQSNAGEWASSRASRETPRLHLVRGHYVSRGEKTFWRTSHLRGNGEWAGFYKTVNVKAGRALP